MTHRSLTPARLFGRQLAARRAPLLLLGIVVMAASLVLTAWPRLTTNIATDDLVHSVDSAGAAVRDPQSALPTDGYYLGAGDEFRQRFESVWAAVPDAVRQARDSMPTALKEVTAPGRYVGQATGGRGIGLPMSGTSRAEAGIHYSLVVEANPTLPSDARLVSGAWPRRVGASDSPLQVVTTVATAQAYSWKIGETQRMTLPGGDTRTVELSGLVQPRDSRSDYWMLDLQRGAPGVTYTNDGAKSGVIGLAWMSAADWTTVAPGLSGQQTVVWFPLKPTAFTIGSLDSVSAGVHRFLSTPTSLGGANGAQLSFTSQLSSVLEQFTASAAPANSLITVFATGPIGVAFAVTVLELALLADLRRAAVVLMRARGASNARIAGAAALETGVASLPGAVIGGLLATSLIPSPNVSLAVASFALCALVPPAIAALIEVSAAHPVRATTARRRRVVVELVVVLVAALAVTLLVQGGGATASVGFTPDPVFVLAPLLVVAGVCVIVLRLFPLVLRALGGVLRRGRGAVGYVGWATSTRPAGAGIWPFFAVIAAVSIAIFSVGVLTTERTGLTDAAILQVRSDITVMTSKPLDGADLRRIREASGVAHVATIQLGSSVTMSPSHDSFDLYFADPAQLAAVQADLPADLRQFSSLGTNRGSLRTAIVGGVGSNSVPSTATLTDFASRSAKPLNLALHKVQLPFGPLLQNSPWVMIDRTDVSREYLDQSSTQAVLISTQPGASGATVASHVRSAITGAGSVTIRTAEGAASAVRSQPIVPGMEALTLAAALISALLCVAAFILTLSMNAPTRRRMLARLRALGFGRRQAAGLIGWELGPLAAVGVVVGVAVGLALAALLLGVVDLTVFTGGEQRPLVHFDPGTITAIALGFVIAAGLATLVAIVGASRWPLAGALREGEDT